MNTAKHNEIAEFVAAEADRLQTARKAFNARSPTADLHFAVPRIGIEAQAFAIQCIMSWTTKEAAV